MSAVTKQADRVAFAGDAVSKTNLNLRGTPSAAPLAPPPMEISTEAPIRTKGEDRLHRVGYAYRIADVLKQAATSRTGPFQLRDTYIPLRIGL